VALTRRGRLTVTVGTTAVVLAVVLLLLARGPLGALLGLGTSPPCTVDTGNGAVDWSGTEAMTATTVAGVGTRIGASDNGVAAAVRRSLTVRRDAPLTAREARAVYRRLPDVARPDEEARALARALRGDRGPALTCVQSLGAADLPVQDIDAVGLTPRTDALRREMRAVFGRQSLGGFQPGGVGTGHIEGSAHYEGRAIDVFFRPVSAAGTRAGWQQAMWAVAHADRLHVATVIFDRQVWSAARSVQGWREYRYPGGRTDNPVLLHEDHVHVDVERGG
jgi:hypothetical protein